MHRMEPFLDVLDLFILFHFIPKLCLDVSVEMAGFQEMSGEGLTILISLSGHFVCPCDIDHP